MTSSTPIAPGYRLERRRIDPLSVAPMPLASWRRHRYLSRDVVMLGALRLVQIIDLGLVDRVQRLRRRLGIVPLVALSPSPARPARRPTVRRCRRPGRRGHATSVDRRAEGRWHVGGGREHGRSVFAEPADGALGDVVQGVSCLAQPCPLLAREPIELRDVVTEELEPGQQLLQLLLHLDPFVLTGPPSVGPRRLDQRATPLAWHRQVRSRLRHGPWRGSSPPPGGRRPWCCQRCAERAAACG